MCMSKVCMCTRAVFRGAGWGLSVLRTSSKSIDE